jgi:hypothetical protein
MSNAETSSERSLPLAPDRLIWPDGAPVLMRWAVTTSFPPMYGSNLPEPTASLPSGPRRRRPIFPTLTRSEHTTYCPYKGDASYYSIPAGGNRSLNAVWTYETPFEAMAQIKGYVTFYPDRVDEIR